MIRLQMKSACALMCSFLATKHPEVLPQLTVLTIVVQCLVIAPHWQVDIHSKNQDLLYLFVIMLGVFHINSPLKGCTDM